MNKFCVIVGVGVQLKAVKVGFFLGRLLKMGGEGSHHKINAGVVR